MIKSAITAVLIAAVMTVPSTPEPVWKDLGTYRITVYCQYCNDPPGGYESKSGKKLKYGYVAMNDVPLGSEISVEGETFKVMDRCGRENTVDIFIPAENGYCQCNYLDYKKVRIRR